MHTRFCFLKIHSLAGNFCDRSHVLVGVAFDQYDDNSTPRLDLSPATCQWALSFSFFIFLNTNWFFADYIDSIDEKCDGEDGDDENTSFGSIGELFFIFLRIIWY